MLNSNRDFQSLSCLIPEDFHYIYPSKWSKRNVDEETCFSATATVLCYIVVGKGKINDRFYESGFLHIFDRSDETIISPQSTTTIFCFELKNADRFLENINLSMFLSEHSCEQRELLGLLESVVEYGYTNVYDASSDFYSLFMKLMKWQNNNETIYSSLIIDAIYRLENSFFQMEGIEDLADQLLISKHHLIRTFSKEVGQSPGRYLEDVRMARAKLFLRATNHTIITISEMVGYGSSNYFAKVFVKSEGMTPSEYRKEYKEPQSSLSPLLKRQMALVESRLYL